MELNNKGIFINKPGEVELIELPMPTRHKGEALLKVLYGGICGSDLGSYRGTFAYVSYPRLPGHEFSAEIVEIDDNAQGFMPGMIITCNPYFNCGHCYSCERGLVNCCTDNQTMGVQRDGAFAKYITMPIERLYHGNSLTARQLTLVEPFCISYHGVAHANVKKGEKVLIVGAGTIGILAAYSAKAFGAEVTICDVAPNKLKLAQQLGIDSNLLNEGSNFLDKVNELTNGNGFDVTIEAVGLPSTFQNCIDAVAFGGRVVLIGVGKNNLDFNFTMIQKKELKIYGSRNAVKSDFENVIKLIKDNNINIENIVTNEFDFDNAADAFRNFHDNSANMLKVIINFN